MRASKLRLPVHLPNRATNRVLVYAGLILFALVFTLPFYWSVLTSLRPNDQMFAQQINFLPTSVTFEHYRKVFSTIPFLDYIKNTAVITALLMTTNIVFCTLAGYAFAKIDFVGKDLVYRIMMLSMMLPATVLVVPQFLVIAKFPLLGGNNILGQGGRGMVGSFWGVIAPTAVSIFNVFFIRQYFITTPNDIAESARIDGAGELEIFLRLYVPLAAPAIATLAVFCFQSGWNSFLWPVIVLQSSNIRVITQGLAAFTFRGATDYGPTMAASLMATVPILIIYACAQKYFIQGIALTGMEQ
jgi:multiple sugar transport system permease protein